MTPDDAQLGTLRDALAKRYGDDVAQSAILAYWARIPRPPLKEAAAFCWRVAWRHATLPKWRPGVDRAGQVREQVWDYTVSEPVHARVRATQLDRLVAREALAALPSAIVDHFMSGDTRNPRCPRWKGFMWHEGRRRRWSCPREGCQ